MGRPACRKGRLWQFKYVSMSFSFIYTELCLFCLECVWFSPGSARMAYLQFQLKSTFKRAAKIVVFSSIAAGREYSPCDGEMFNRFEIQRDYVRWENSGWLIHIWGKIQWSRLVYKHEKNKQWYFPLSSISIIQLTKL